MPIGSSGHAAAIEAYFIGLKSLLTDPDIRSTVRSSLLQALPDLFAAKKGGAERRIPFPQENKHTETTGAFYDMLLDPAIRPYITVKQLREQTQATSIGRLRGV